MARQECTSVMNIEFYKKPWKHFSITNLLDDKTFKKVNKFSKKIEAQNCRNNVQVRVTNYPVMYNLLKPYIYVIAKEVGITSTANLYPAVEFDVIKPGWAYNKIHNDNPSKVMTFILAISATGSGTHLYKNQVQSAYSKTTDWLPNGGNGFVRSNKTWHDFDSLQCTENRRTAILMLTKEEFY